MNQVFPHHPFGKYQLQNITEFQGNQSQYHKLFYSLAYHIYPFSYIKGEHAHYIA